ASPKLTTGSSLRATTITCIPFASVKRSILGSASASGLGGGGAPMRSVRPVQKVDAVGPAGLAGADSYCTSMDPGEAGDLGGALPAQPNSDSASGRKIDARTRLNSRPVTCSPPPSVPQQAALRQAAPRTAALRWAARRAESGSPA